MNKPAAKEPSMDEILSSIRQIIADDDATPEASPSPADSAPAGGNDLPSFDAFLADEGVEEAAEPELESVQEPAFDIPEEFNLSEPEEEPEDALALSLDQVVGEADEDVSDEANVGTEDFVLPDDVAFVTDEADLPLEPVRAPSVQDVGAMPDPKLSADMTEHLLDGATQQAASQAFAQLGGMGFAAGGQTVESVVRELLRPMLKAWLDENLPATVERLVQREIERVSRGGR